MQSSLQRPYIVTVVPEAPVEARVTTVSDVLVGSVGLAGLLLGVALVLGIVFGGVRVALRRLRPSASDHLTWSRPHAPESPGPERSPRESAPQ